MELPEALATAIQFEHQVRDHYAQCARQAQDPKGKKVFAILAREEQGHVDYLETRLGEWKAKGVIVDAPLPTVLPPMAKIKAEAAKATAQAPKAAAQGEKPAAPAKGMAELEYLKQALELERNASASYRKLVASLAPAHRGMFERFLEIEDGHVTIVQAEIDALVGHGHWFDFQEFSLESGY